MSFPIHKHFEGDTSISLDNEESVRSVLRKSHKNHKVERFMCQHSFVEDDKTKVTPNSTREKFVPIYTSLYGAVVAFEGCSLECSKTILANYSKKGALYCLLCQKNIVHENSQLAQHNSDNIFLTCSKECPMKYVIITQ